MAARKARRRGSRRASDSMLMVMDAIGAQGLARRRVAVPGRRTGQMAVAAGALVLEPGHGRAGSADQTFGASS